MVHSQSSWNFHFDAESGLTVFKMRQVRKDEGKRDFSPARAIVDLKKTGGSKE
jgi:hypothetical protein